MIGDTWQRQLCNARCNVTRRRAIIRDQGSNICEGIDKQYFRVAYLQKADGWWDWGWWPSVWSSASWFASPQSWLLPEVSSELLEARTEMWQWWRCHPRNLDQWAGVHRAVSRGYNYSTADALGGRLHSWRGLVQWHNLASRQSRWWTLLKEKKRGAPRCGCLCTIDAQEQKVPVERHRFEELSTRSHGTLSQRQLWSR